MEVAFARRPKTDSSTPSGETDALQRGLTLNELQEMAWQHNPSLSELDAVVDKARGVYDQVGRYPNPTIGYTGEEIGDDGTLGLQGGFLSQTFVTGGKLDLNQQVAAGTIQTLRWEFEAQRMRVANDVRTRFFEVLGAEEQLRTVRELRRVAEEGVRTAESLFQAKQAARPNVLQAKVELNQVRMRYQSAENRYEAAWQRMANVVGRPELKPMRLSGNLEDVPADFQWDSAYESLLSSSPQLQAAYSRVERAKSLWRRQTAQPIPNLKSRLAVVHDNASGDNLATVELGIDLPIFDGNQGNIDAAYAEIRRAEHEASRLELALRDRLTRVFREYKDAKQQVHLYRNDILPDAQENLSLTEEGYRLGEFGFQSVLTARRTFFQANLSYVQTLTELQTSATAINGLLLSGGLNDVADTEVPVQPQR